ncbi:NAD(P)(+) transhydrogenase (Re/Si-specific) subunit beta [Paraburkholderia lacunae]|uniref:NADP transhydrogenase subunit beta n=1 Tax=Paraburkholderia lacunae TaxID=2211104 RepID=A0A370N1N2_9BURK|nr:NAD(P)(+) transhydrogenase (Re/Si-specific) subunit beta [Paraburkholderia lacunae]RDJ99506.1 NADP transhydrogenase subunit beta [Paraburkholderia lacunae]
MLLASDSTVWMGAGFLLAAVLAAVLAAIGQLPLARRSRRRPYWHAGALAAALAGLLAAGVGASGGVVTAGLAGAALGAWLVRRRDLTRRPRLVALLGSSAGIAAMAGGFARYVTSAPSSAALANVERIELYAAIFIGALIFATSAIVFCKLTGLLEAKDADAPARPSHHSVNLLALVLCGWLGYGFVTEQAEPFGLAALFAMSVLAAALGAHLMLSREYSNGHGADAHGFAGRCHGLVLARPGLLARIEWHDGDEPMWTLRETSPRGMARTGAYRHGRSRRNGSYEHRYQRACARYRSTRRATRGQA